MKVSNLTELFMTKTSTMDSVSGATSDDGFSKEMQKAEQREDSKVETTTDSKKPDDEVVSEKDEVKADETANSENGEDAVQNQNDGQQQDTQNKVAEEVAAQAKIPEQSNGNASGLTEQFEPMLKTVGAEQPTTLTQDAAVTRSQLNSQETAIASQALQSEEQIANTNKGVEIADEGTAFANKVLEEANVIIEKQQGASAQDEQGLMDNMKKNEDQTIVKESTVLQDNSFAKVAQDGSVELKTVAKQMPQVEQQERILSQILDGVRNTATAEKTELFLQLKPDYLGGLSILLSAEENGLVAKLQTSNQMVYQAMQADMDQLQATLKEKGIQVTQLEVVLNQTTDTSGQAHSGGRQGQFEQSKNTQGRAVESIESATAYYDAVSQYVVLAEQGGSVEFTA